MHRRQWNYTTGKPKGSEKRIQDPQSDLYNTISTSFYISGKKIAAAIRDSALF